MRRRETLALMIAIGCAVPNNSVLAQDASFGRKVLLCSTAIAPGWVGIPYCVPVIQALFQILAAGMPWPACPEASADQSGDEADVVCSGISTSGPNESAPLASSARVNRCASLGGY